ncbi:MAG: tetratricopeptide repeat protein [Candidatus Heimdallarchaeota archaeon]|nr:MAG: tetratricopeptide repeat protein [Candidatus Heimdallarchaeota archaeon]
MLSNMDTWFERVPELSLHLRRLTSDQAKEIIEFSRVNHWETKDFHQISREYEEFIQDRRVDEPKYSELLYLQAKLLFFAGDLAKLNDLFTLSAVSQDIPGVQLYYALGLAFQGHSKEGLEILEHIDLDLYDSFIKLEILSVTLFIYSIKRDYLAVSDFFYQIYNHLDSKEFTDELRAHLLPWAYLRQAYSIRAQGKVFEAMELIETCYTNLRSYPHRFFQVMALTLMGHCHHNLGNIQRALEFYDQAIDISVEIQSWILLSILYNRVALAMMAQKKPKLAKRYFNQAITQAKQSNANWLIIGPLVNLAQYKLAEGKISEAIDDYHQFVEVALGTGDEQELCYAQLTLAELYKGIGDIPKSKYFLSEGFKLALKLGIFRTISRPEDEANYN